jgi:hypothetical protein
VPAASCDAEYQNVVMFETYADGGEAVPSNKSYDVAPADFQLNVGVAVTPAVPLAGLPALGISGADPLEA